MKATIFTPQGAAPVRVRDLSADGAFLSSTHPLPAAGDLIFKRGALFVAGQVVWSDTYQAGIRFYRSLSSQELAGSHHTVLHD